MKHQFHSLTPAQDGPISYFPTPTNCLTQPELYDRQILLPFLTVPGELISPRYAGLHFHLVGHPVGWSDLTFRLHEDGRYELLEVDGESGAELRAMLEAEEADDELFDSAQDEPTAMQVAKVSEDELHEDYVIEIGCPTWAQSTYNKIPPSDEPDRTITGFQDDDGNPMEFILASFEMMDVFGYYYLFYAPETRTVMQVFQCT